MNADLENNPATGSVKTKHLRLGKSMIMMVNYIQHIPAVMSVYRRDFELLLSSIPMLPDKSKCIIE